MIQHLSIHLNDDTRFMLPYLKRALPGVIIDEHGNCSKTDFAVLLSSTDIYRHGQICDADENEATDPRCKFFSEEKEFAAWVAKENVHAVILRCTDIIGTGMTGFPRELANSIWRGTFFHFPGNDAKRSTIHANDVAGFIAALAEKFDGNRGSAEIFNITDGSNPTVHNLAEALAYRMNNKRISTLSTRPQQWIGRFVYGKQKYESYTNTRTFSNAKVLKVSQYSPTAVCEYLRTHIYDESSL